MFLKVLYHSWDIWSIYLKDDILGNKKNLAVLATGSGKTYLACLASYRLLNYTSVKRVLFLVDRNNLARQTESEFSMFDRTESQQKMGSLYTINLIKKLTLTEILLYQQYKNFLQFSQVKRFKMAMRIRKMSLKERTMNLIARK